MDTRLRDPEWRSALEHHSDASGAGWLQEIPALESAGCPADQTSVPPLDRLVARNLCVQVGGANLLHGVDFSLAPGEVGAILGPNGAGKSTLLSVLAGLRAPTQGVVWLNGQAVRLSNLAAFAAVRAVLPQDTQVAFDFRVRDVVALGRYPHRLNPSTEEAGIVEAAMALTDVLALAERAVSNLSGGERARVQLARVLAQIWEPTTAPRWLLVDEPTAALDLHHQHQTLRTLRRWSRDSGVGVVAVLHDLNLALRYVDQAWVLDGGRLQAQGPPEQVLTPALVRRVWRVPVSAVRDAYGVAQLLVGATP
jgi:iron complex transport system ATP-binding protein